MARSARRYPRTARINELIREVIAEALERVDDDRLTHVAITDVDCDAELTVAQVYFDTLDASDQADAEATEAFVEHGSTLRKVLSHQTRLKRTPELRFSPDPAVRAASKIDSILGNIEPAADYQLDESNYKNMDPTVETAAESPAASAGGQTEDVLDRPGNAE